MSLADSPNLHRILVVGDTGVGKTLFLRRLRYTSVRDRGIFFSSWGPTIGFCVETILASQRRNSLSTMKKSSNASYIAFIELGGNRNFGSGGQLSLGLMSFDGVIFVYDRHSASSASGLSYWYESLKSYGIVGGDGGAKIMLLETALTLSTSSSLAYSHQPPDELLGVYFQDAVRDAPLLERSLGRLHNACREWWNKWRLSVKDFQNRQGGIRLYITLFLFHSASVVENFLLFLMAVALFGPNQKSVPLSPPSVEESLSTIRNDAGATHIVEACPLYDQVAFEGSALEEVMLFVNSLRNV